ncbi:hypothetical protein ACFRIB_53145 [Streptomyces mirabilis]|uniref:hypothetical protein n=1 Tax=Streptomyces mirabilis TaxID=68239 RepID=UPI00367E3013
MDLFEMAGPTFAPLPRIGFSAATYRWPKGRTSEMHPADAGAGARDLRGCRRPAEKIILIKADDIASPTATATANANATATAVRGNRLYITDSDFDEVPHDAKSQEGKINFFALFGHSAS